MPAVAFLLATAVSPASQAPLATLIRNQPAAPAAAAPAAAPVAAPAQSSDGPQSIHHTGPLVAEQQADIAAERAGRIVKH